MPRMWRVALSRILTPDDQVASFDRRGFRAATACAREHLELVGRTFLNGLRTGLEARAVEDSAATLEQIEREFRGFGYEGAAMGFALRDAIRFGSLGPGYVERLLVGQGQAHVYMVHVGLGWAMARLPRWRWSRIVPRDPLHRWLTVDGLGFCRAYFDTAQVVHQQVRDARPVWPGGDPGYTGRALDQGLGRALWFVEGADVVQVADRIERFSPQRHPDLWSGVGLAATYAGGTGVRELRELRERAGQHWPQLAQGSAFAAKARLRAGLAGDHTRSATETLCGCPPEQAAAVTDRALVNLPDDEWGVPSFEVWRRRTAGAFIR